jgi:energy-coupling factor transport system permease protein
MAMEARCYRGGEGRTRMKQMKLTARDVLAGMAVTAGMVVIGVYL